MTGRRNLFPALLMAALALAALLFWMSYRYDNTYTRPYIPAEAGRLSLAGIEWDSLSLLYLVDGWELYQHRWLTPGQLEEYTPDAYVFMGEHAGIDLGDKSAPPHGAATYRLTITTDGVPRSYALYMPRVYAPHQIWINGQKQRRDTEGAYTGAVYFLAETHIEIVVAASSDSYFFSGMVHPPALGAPEAVNKTVIVQLICRSAQLLAALLTGLQCLSLGLRRACKRHACALALLCLCFIGFCAYPVVQALGLKGRLWHDIEQFSYYAMFFSIIWLQGHMLKLPQAVLRAAMTITGAVCPCIPIISRLGMRRGGAMNAISNGLAVYIWAVSLYLIVSTALTLRKGGGYSRGLLVGFCIFALSLVFDRALPRFQPIIFGWHTETAGFIIVAIFAALFFLDTGALYRERLSLLEKNRNDRLLIASQLEKMRSWQRYVDQTNMLMHEVRSRALVMRTKLNSGDLSAVETMLSEMSGSETSPGESYTRHDLLNALLGWAFDKAKAQGIRHQCTIEGVTDCMPMEENDLAGLVINLLENAVEANLSVNPQGRYIAFSVKVYGGVMVVQCANPYSPRLKLRSDSGRHGYGLRVVRSIADKYHGAVSISRDNSLFSVTITLELVVNARVREPAAVFQQEL